MGISQLRTSAAEIATAAATAPAKEKEDENNENEENEEEHDVDGEVWKYIYSGCLTFTRINRSG